jgi:hypothetical protein
MRKGIAVPYVIALILGIIVVGVIGYWFFVLGGKGGGTGTETACQAKLVSFCTQWSLKGYDQLGSGEHFLDENPDCNIGKPPFSTIEGDEEGTCRDVLGQGSSESSEEEDILETLGG